MSRGASVLLVSVLAAASAEAVARLDDEQIKESVAQVAASEHTVVLVAEYETCPASVLTDEHRMRVSSPLLLKYKVGQAVAVESTNEGIALKMPAAELSATPAQAFQDETGATGLNAADAAAFVALLAEHAAALGTWLTVGGGPPEVAREIQRSFALAVEEQTRARNDTRGVVAAISTSRDDVPAPDLQLCPGTTIALKFPERLTDADYSGRGATPVAGSAASSTLRVYLKNTGGQVIAYREAEGRLAAPVGRVKVLAAPRTTGATIGGGEGVKIVNGTLAPTGMMPWAVAFVRPGEDGKPAAFCGGTLITDTWVVTAAHCRLVENGDAIIGRTDLRKNDGEIRKVKAVWRHIDFGSRAARYDSDVALVELKTSATAKKAVLAAAAPPENSAVTVAGWGATEEGGKTVQQLAFVELDVEPHVPCMYTYSRTATPVTQKMFCASKVRERKDACQGDSGGGSFRTAAHDALELVGIVSFGKGCASPGYPGVYTRLADFRQWLTEVQQAAGE